MPAFSKSFPWPSHYGHFDFFEEKLKNHTRVSSFEAKGHGLYSVQRTDGTSLRVFVCECYSFGLAEYLEMKGQHGDVDAVVINSNWCGYTNDAKTHSGEEGVGLFKIGELMSALHKNKLVE